MSSIQHSKRFTDDPLEPPHPTPRELWVLFLAYNILVGPGIILG